MTTALGLDIGGTKIAGAVFTPDGKQLAERIVPTPKTYESFLDACVSLVRTLETEVGATCTVGAGLPGVVDHEKGIVFCVNIPSLTNKALRNDLEKRLERPVPLANDANCLALAEAVDGAGKGARSVLALIIGTGVGAGLVFEGKIIDGCNGLSGEVGHVPLPFREEADGPLVPCNCGQVGCLEKAVAGPALARLYDFMTDEGELDAAQIAAKALQRDAQALNVLDRYYEIVAKSMIIPIHIFDPDIIVVSGGVSDLPGLYEEVPKRWGKYCLAPTPKTRFVRAKHGAMAGLRGAAWLGRNSTKP